MMENRTVIDPEVRHGKPPIKNKRVPVEAVWGVLAAGVTIEEIMEEYDREKEDVVRDEHNGEYHTPVSTTFL